MTESRSLPPRPTRRPGGAIVFWASAALFAVLFALLTFQLGGGPPAGTIAADGTAETVGPIAVVPAPTPEPASELSRHIWRESSEAQRSAA